MLRIIGRFWWLGSLMLPPVTVYLVAILSARKQDRGHGLCRGICFCIHETKSRM